MDTQLVVMLRDIDANVAAIAVDVAELKSAALTEPRIREITRDEIRETGRLRWPVRSAITSIVAVLFTACTFILGITGHWPSSHK